MVRLTGVFGWGGVVAFVPALAQAMPAPDAVEEKPPAVIEPAPRVEISPQTPPRVVEPPLESLARRQPQGRYAAGLGLRVARNEEAQKPLAGAGGIGGHVTMLGAPPSWPALFGLQLGGELYQLQAKTFSWQGQHQNYDVTLRRFSAMGVVRLAPEGWTVSPRFDMLAGLLYYFVGVEKRGAVPNPFFPNAETDSTLAGRATYGFGLAAGIDINLPGPKGLTEGLGIAVQWMSGGDLFLPAVASARTRGGALAMNDVSTPAFGQIMFLVELTSMR